MNILIVGSGIAGISVAQALKELRGNDEVTIITRDSELSYHRPMLSHSIGSDNLDLLVNRTFEQLRMQGIRVIDSAEVTHIDSDVQQVRYQKNAAQRSLAYDQLIMANGSSAFIPHEYQFLRDDCFVLHSMEDLLRIRHAIQLLKQTKSHLNVAILGAGAIGCELASEFHLYGAKVTLIHRNKLVADRLLDQEQSLSLTRHFQQIGIDLQLESAVKQAAVTGAGIELKVENDRVIGMYDMVILAFGFAPNISLAQTASIQCQRGIVVDSYLRTSAPNIFAIGDVAEVQGKVYQYIYPIWQQAQFLAEGMVHGFSVPWQPPTFSVNLKIHNFS